VRETKQRQGESNNTKNSRSEREKKKTLSQGNRERERERNQFFKKENRVCSSFPPSFFEKNQNFWRRRERGSGGGVAVEWREKESGEEKR